MTEDVINILDKVVNNSPDGFMSGSVIDQCIENVEQFTYKERWCC